MEPFPAGSQPGINDLGGALSQVEALRYTLWPSSRKESERMVAPNCLVTPSLTSPRRAFARAIAHAGLMLNVIFTGCGVVSQSKMDEYHRVAQTLRAENSRLKDVSLVLRTRNQDLSQRAVDDAKRLSAQEEVVASLENSVQAYQAEREKLAESFESLKRQVRVAVNNDATHAFSATPSPEPSRLESFAKDHEGWTFDPEKHTLSSPVNHLFEPGRDRLTSQASKTLKVLASELVNTEATASLIEVMAVGDAPPPVEKAGFNTDAVHSKASARFLATARAARVREQLVGQGGLAPKLVKIVAPPAQTEFAPNDSDRSDNRRVEIRLASKEPARLVNDSDLPGPVEVSDP